MKRVIINIRASKNISGLVKVSVTSPAGLMKFFLNVEPCNLKYVIDNDRSNRTRKKVAGPAKYDIRQSAEVKNQI